MSWYRTGTVAVTNGSKTVTGVGTLWTTAVNAGDAFALVDANLNPTDAWYEVESVTNNTTLVLKQSYAGSTGSNKQYCVFNLVGNMTTPSFAQRLATFFASFQSLIDKPTTTPTASSIPIADSGGKIADGWIPATVARLASPTFTGTPTAPTQTASDNSTKIATTKFVKDQAYYNKANILGTVSQSGGVPTGAVIERGSNANGEYVKFADGTLVCVVSTSVTPLACAVFTDTIYRCVSNWTLPATHLSTAPYAFAGKGADELYALISLQAGSWAAGTISILGYTKNTDVTEMTFDAMFIGRWF